MMEISMEDLHATMSRMYAAFNRRDVNGVLAMMSEDVSWPKASEGGRVVGKEAIRAYWTRQWAEFDPRVEVLYVIETDDGRLDVRVHQVVKDLDGVVFADGEVRHVYTFADGLIERMDVLEDGAVESSGPSAAFAKH